MLDEYDKIISKDASCYIQEMCNAYGNSGNSITNYPLIEYLMSSVLLRLTGFMEQKLDTLQLILCDQDEDFRYQLLRKSNKLSSSYEVIASIYSSFQNIISSQEKNLKTLMPAKFSPSLFENTTCIYQAYDKIYNIFKDSSIVNPLKRSFNDFCNLNNYFIDLDSQIQNIINELKNPALSKEERKIKGDEIKKLTRLNKKNKKSSFLSAENFISIYNRTIKFRHSIAHNINSIKKDLPSISFIKDAQFQYENYFIRFMIVLCVDEIIRTMYEHYRKIKFKYLL